MRKEFLQQLFQKQQGTEAVPSNEEINSWASRVLCVLYPEQARCSFGSMEQIQEEFTHLERDLKKILDATKACQDCDNGAISREFFDQVPEIFRLLNLDITAILEGDPAARTTFEIIRAYPGFHALSYYRLAHALYLLEVPHIPRILTECAHSRTGIDIHPGAAIGEYFFIDHGTGIVIGETARIGNHVKLYQGTTLGALSVDKSMARTKRHPTVEDHVVIYSGATILGGETIIGHHSTIGGNVWLTKSVPSGSTVYHTPEIVIVEGKVII